jgi:hypothetical protein
VTASHWQASRGAVVRACPLTHVLDPTLSQRGNSAAALRGDIVALWGEIECARLRYVEPQFVPRPHIHAGGHVNIVEPLENLQTWSGLVVAPPRGFVNFGGFGRVSATWNIPNVAITGFSPLNEPPNLPCVVWVGFDGVALVPNPSGVQPFHSSPNLWQGGVLCEVPNDGSGAQPTCSVWFELNGAGSNSAPFVTFPFPATIGDLFSVVILKEPVPEPPFRGAVRFIYKNLTQGAYTHFVLSSGALCFARSAEWIVERLTQGIDTNTLPRFGSVYFDQASCWYSNEGFALQQDASTPSVWTDLKVGASNPPQELLHVWRNIIAHNGTLIAQGEPVTEGTLRCRYTYPRG